MTKRRMPQQKPHVSDSAVGTPWPVVNAACKKLRIPYFNYDLAADASNTKAGTYFTEQDNALVQDWVATKELWSYKGGSPWNWLNPPYSPNIYPWAEKCVQEAERGAYTAMLVPSSTGTTWWNDCVHGYAYILALRGRITFLGHDKPYPKDLALVLYTPQGFNGIDIWDWRAELKP